MCISYIGNLIGIFLLGYTFFLKLKFETAMFSGQNRFRAQADQKTEKH